MDANGKPLSQFKLARMQAQAEKEAAGQVQSEKPVETESAAGARATLMTPKAPLQNNSGGSSVKESVQQPAVHATAGVYERERVSPSSHPYTHTHAHKHKHAYTHVYKHTHAHTHT